MHEVGIMAGEVRYRRPQPTPCAIGKREATLDSVTTPGRRSALRALAILPVVAASLPAHAAASGKAPRVGVLSWGPEEYASRYFTPHFLQALGELGYTVGRNLAIEWRFSDGDTARDARIAEELRTLQLDAIVTAGSERTEVLRRALPATPLIAHMEDPVGRGHAKSLARPGGTVTGLTVEVELTAVKQFGLMRRLMPKLAHVEILIEAVTRAPELRAAPAMRAAQQAGLSSAWKIVDGLAGFEQAFAALRAHDARAAFIVNTRPSTDIRMLSPLAIRHRVATMSLYRVFVEQGGLLAYFVNNVEVGRRLAALLDKVLRGARPGDIPFEQPTRFDFVLNRGTARELGLEIPRGLLLEADQVIG